MSDDFIDKEDLNEENIPANEEQHSDYKPADAKSDTIKHQLTVRRG